MFNKMFKKRTASNEKIVQPIKETLIVIKLNERIMPIDRGEHYEDSLDDFLRANQYGEVLGGGTLQGENGEIKFCDIEVIIYEGNDLKKIIGEIINRLEELGVPKGSNVTIENTKEEISFGKKEGVAIYLDGANLPKEVYEQCDINFVLSELSSLVGYEGEILRYWEGETETALYFYGDSFEEMNNAISGFVSTYPLCERARITQIA